MPGTILVAVNDSDARELVTRALGGAFRILDAHDGASALEMLDRETPAAVIAEFFMPQMDGYEVIRRMKRDARMTRIPVLLVVAEHNEDRVRQWAEPLGNVGTLATPLDENAVRETVRAAMYPGETKTPASVKASSRTATFVGATAALFTANDIESLARCASRTAREALFAQCAHVYLRDAAGAAVARTASGLADDELASLLWSPGYTQAYAELRTACEQGRAMTVSLPAQSSQESSSSSDRLALVGVPIVLRGDATHPDRVLGFLCVLDRIDGGTFTDDDRFVAHALADQIALAHANVARLRELDRAAREWDAFNYAVAHDLRAPLRLIDAQVQMVGLMSQKLPRPVVVQLEQIQRGAAHLNELVDGLLNVARVRQLEMNPTRVELRRLVDNAIEALAIETVGRTIDWRIDALPAVSCDPELMRQVFLSLLGNAVKYTRPNSSARIEIGVDSSPIPHIYVRDDGVGFDMNYAAKLFGLFQRLHRQDEFEGVGTGLAIASRIIERHGGRIWAESEPGRGATFRFSLSGLGQEPSSASAP
jgi:signal transduction histidine kinase/CheY-like chemotaxis protein